MKNHKQSDNVCNSRRDGSGPFLVIHREKEEKIKEHRERGSGGRGGVIPQRFFVFLFTLKPNSSRSFPFNPAIPPPPPPTLRHPTTSAPSPHDVSQEESNLRNDIMNDA